MTDTIDPTTYNYTVFKGQGDFESFPAKVPVGSVAPDISAVLLETGQTVQLSDYWRERDVLVEFGSYT